MSKHKWYNEIVAWASGAEIEYRHSDDNWYAMKNPSWNNQYLEYRIKPQPKEPQYLYVYYGKLNDGGKGYFFEQQRVPYIENGYIGKIKLENEDES
jgi:hypothetical protein